jgi:surface carbohydrate biosynthesis protein
MKVAFLVVNPYRDLPNLVLTSLYLCQKGCTCYLVPLYLRQREIWTLAPDFVVLHNLRLVIESFAARLLEAGIQVGALDTEGGVFSSLDWYGGQLARDAALRHRISCFCSWGPRVADYARRHQWFLDHQLYTTGTPRLDFYVEPWREATLRMSAFADDVPRPFVLINGNFQDANPWIPKELGPGNPYGYDQAALSRQYETKRRGLQEMTGLTNRLAAALPGTLFVYRPHPFEDPALYHRLLESRDNLRVIKQGSVDGWILRTAALVHRGCSTAIEAALAGVPAYSPEWIPLPARFDNVEAVSIPCSSEDELAERLQYTTRHGPALPDLVRGNLSTVISDWFHAADGLSHRHVGDAILDSFTRHASRVSLDHCRKVLDGLDQPAAGLSRRVRTTARRLLRRPPFWSFRHWSEVPDLEYETSPRFFDAAQVQSLVAALQPSASRLYPAWRPVQVHDARQRGDYHFGYTQGRSIVLGI